MTEVPEFHDDMTLRDILDPAMRIARSGDKEAAAEFRKRYCDYLQRNNPEWSDAEVQRVFDSNLGYGAGYYGRDDMAAVRETFGSRHPVFG